MGFDRLGERNKLQVQETKGRQHMTTDCIQEAKEMEPIQGEASRVLGSYTDFLGLYSACVVNVSWYLPTFLSQHSNVLWQFFQAMSNALCAISLQFKGRCRGLKHSMSIWINERLAYYCLVVSLWGSYIIPLRLGVFIFPSSTGAMDLIWLGLGEDQIPDKTDGLVSCNVPSLPSKALSNNDHLAQPLTYPVIYNLTIWTLKASWTEVKESNSDPWMKKRLHSHKHQ